MSSYKRPITIENFGEEPRKSLHHPDLPADIRMLIVGPSNCGKTVVAINMAVKYIKWTRLYIISLSPDQPIYNDLKQLNEYRNCIEFLEPDEANFDDFIPSSLIIFDDYMTQKDQSLPITVFTRGRHKKLNVIYITQKFTKTELAIRNNCNMVIAFRCDNRSKLDMHDAYLGGVIEYDEFKNIPLKDRDFLVIEPGKPLKKNFSSF